MVKDGERGLIGLVSSGCGLAKTSGDSAAWTSWVTVAARGEDTVMAFSVVFSRCVSDLEVFVTGPSRCLEQLGGGVNTITAYWRWRQTRVCGSAFGS